VAAHLDISAVTLRRLVEAKVIDDAEPGEMDLDASRVNYIRHLRAGAGGRSRRSHRWVLGGPFSTARHPDQGGSAGRRFASQRGPG